MYKTSAIMQSVDIVLKRIKAILIYNMLREGVPKSNGTWENNTSGYIYLERGIWLDKECSFLVPVFTRIRFVFAGIPTRPIGLAYFLWSDRDLHPNVWSILVTLEVLWLRCRTYQAARRWIISSWFICMKV